MDGTLPAEAGNGSAEKRPYVPPKITFCESLEVIAAVCTAGPGNPAKAISGVGGCVIATS